MLVNLTEDKLVLSALSCYTDEKSHIPFGHLLKTAWTMNL